MQLSNPRFFRTAFCTLVILSFLSLTAHSQAFADSATVLWNFGVGQDGNVPNSSLIADNGGNLYGTTQGGGSYGTPTGPGGGTVFKISPPATPGGNWTESILWSFGNGSDGNVPSTGLGLIMDGSGNLYGTTSKGGAYGAGTLFEITPKTGGSWTESILWSFGNGSDGSTPSGGLILDSNGNLYGTTRIGGDFSHSGGSCLVSVCGGTVFELSPPATLGGNWSEAILWNFGNGTDGANPYSAPIMDTDGNLYGTTLYGGIYPGVGGTVFELSPPAMAGGNWTESILWSFGNGTDGSGPVAGLILDSSGNLYGTTETGGTYSSPDGTAFELSPPSAPGGKWTESVLWNFGDGSDAAQPEGGVIMDKSGNLYGTTLYGGAYVNPSDGEGFGAAFELSSPSAPGGAWTESVLWNFEGNDGHGPSAGLIVDAGGNLFGTAHGGSNSQGLAALGGGAVFEISPGPPQPTPTPSATPTPSMGRISVSTKAIVLKGKPGKPKSKKLKVKNIGKGPLTVTGTEGLSAQLSSSGAGTIAPKKSLTIKVTDTPTTGGSTTTQTLKILSDDPTRSEVDISVTGNSP